MPTRTQPRSPVLIESIAITRPSQTSGLNVTPAFLKSGPAEVKNTHDSRSPIPCVAIRCAVKLISKTLRIILIAHPMGKLTVKAAPKRPKSHPRSRCDIVSVSRVHEACRYAFGRIHSRDRLCGVGTKE